MKRALVLSLVVVLGLGVGAFAQLAGSWESTLSFNLGAVSFEDYIVDLTSMFKVDYTLAGWTFSSESEFDLTGFASQGFAVEGQLGAFTFSSMALFAPSVVTVFKYPDVLGTQTSSYAWCALYVPTAHASAPMFLSLEADASISIAGVEASVFVLMDQSNVPVQYVDYAINMDGTQTDSWVLPSLNNGIGTKITLSGSIGGMDVTSYTYFNLTEKDTASTYCPKIGKAGTYTIGADGCDLAFTEEYVMFQGLTFGCVEIDAALKIFCTGFDSLKIVANGIDIGGWATFNVGIKFGVASKALDLCLTLNSLSFSCIAVEIGFNENGYAEAVAGSALTIQSIQIHGFSLTTEIGAVTFTSATELDVWSKQFSTAAAWKYIYGEGVVGFAIPWAGLNVPGSYTPEYCLNGITYPSVTVDPVYIQTDAGFKEWVCVPEYRYRLWERFTIGIDEDACCGGLFGVDIVTYFGNLEKLSWFAYDVIDAGTGIVSGIFYAPGYLVAGYTAQTSADDLCYDSVVFDYGYAAVSGAAQLFNWAYTTVSFSVGMGSNLTLNVGAGVSAFGWESLDLGFEFTW